MIPAAVRSTRCFAALFLLGTFTTTTGDDPFSVLTGFQQQLSRITSLRATVKRRQTYRDVRRDAQGVLQYSDSGGIRYEWKSPGHYLFIATDSILCGINMTKRCGWRSVPTDNRLRHQVDPLGRLLRLQSIPPEEFAYRGNNDSLLFFTLAAERRTFCTIGIEPGTLRCRIIERFGEKQTLLEKTVFTYGKKNDTDVLPHTIIISGLFGAELSVDTISIVRPNRKAVEKKAFVLPEGITWGKVGFAECLPQEQLHGGSGP
ncbi:MAG: hypothetical protein JW863_21565 [Chitinispirillaceae bacterium]|nr:hypothetical protein [Chitinispirillaceae bacterium]